jgi:hypothetical protein
VARHRSLYALSSERDVSNDELVVMNDVEDDGCE